MEIENAAELKRTSHADTLKINKVLSGSFAWMATGLFISFAVSVFVLLNRTLTDFLFNYRFGFLICLGVELGLVIYLSARITKLTSGMARFYFLLYAMVSGLTLSVIFFSYEISSILSVFISCSVMFAVLALYGATTKKDLSGYGKMALFGLIGLVVALLVNLFIKSTMFDLILAWIGVVVFTMLTAYDVQKIKAYAEFANTDEEIRKASVYGALSLYLDFINLFLSLLRIFGRRR